AESLEDKNVAKVHRCQLEKLKSQCDRLTEELTQNENENKKLKLKYQSLKDQLEEKEKHISNEEEHLRRMEEARLQLKDQLLCLETEQESILGVIGREIDAACKTFSRDSMEKLKVFSSSPDIHYDPHRWLAESKTKLQWLCEELKERENREKNLRHQLMLSRQQLRDLTQNKESELQCLFQQIERQELLLDEIHREKRAARWRRGNPVSEALCKGDLQWVSDSRPGGLWTPTSQPALHTELSRCHRWDIATDWTVTAAQTVLPPPPQAPFTTAAAAASVTAIAHHTTRAEVIHIKPLQGRSAGITATSPGT
ncbi:centrosomal protein of 128 kDa-like, partial [Carlito syrichta]|uniref:Centrosomal protein of 128 kDa-like n=1 Tax=Carlito syrichta TaxID=1868482 RepID=A0A3Q0DVL7_CARSF